MSKDIEQGGKNVLPFVRPTRSRAEEERPHRPRKTNAHKQISREFRNASSDWEYFKKYKVGQILQCRILNPEPGGYAVITTVSELPGYLPSDIRRQVGDEILVTFVCLAQSRLLLSERFTARGSRLANRVSVDWEKCLKSVDESQAVDNLDEWASRADAEKDMTDE